MKTMRELVPDVMQHIEQLSREATRRRRNLEQFAKEKPQQRACPNGGRPHPLNLDASSRASLNGEFVLIYDACLKCRVADDMEWLRSAGVPSILLSASLDNWIARTGEDRKLLKAAKDFARDCENFLVLSGPVGLGKTHLAVGVMRERGHGKMITQNRFVLKVHERYHSDTAENIIETCKRTRFLVLDECGFTSGARDELPAIYEVLDYRHGEKKATVLTTNVSVDQFGEVFGDRIADRLLCHQPFLVLMGDSWRGVKK